MILKFGKFKGCSITQCDREYLGFLLKQDWLKPDLREAIEQTLRGTYVSPVAVPEQPQRPPYQPPDIHERMMKATKTGARRVLADVGQQVEALEMPQEYKSMVLEMLLVVAKQIV